MQLYCRVVMCHAGYVREDRWIGESNSTEADGPLTGVRRPSGLMSSAPPVPVYSTVDERVGRDCLAPDGETCRLSGRAPGLRSMSSGSGGASPASVVSIPFAVPWRAPAAGTRSMGRAPRRRFGPERMRLLEVSSLGARSTSFVRHVHFPSLAYVMCGRQMWKVGGNSRAENQRRENKGLCHIVTRTVSLR